MSVLTETFIVGTYHLDLVHPPLVSSVNLFLAIAIPTRSYRRTNGW